MGNQIQDLARADAQMQISFVFPREFLTFLYPGARILRQLFLFFSLPFLFPRLFCLFADFRVDRVSPGETKHPTLCRQEESQCRQKRQWKKVSVARRENGRNSVSPEETIEESRICAGKKARKKEEASALWARMNRHPIIHCRTSEGVSEVSERANE